MLSASLPLPLLQGSNQLSQYDVILLTLPHTMQSSSICTRAALLWCAPNHNDNMQPDNLKTSLCALLIYY